MPTVYSPKEKIVEKEIVLREGAPHVLCTAPAHFLPDMRQELESLFSVTYGYNLTREEVMERLEGIDALLLNPGAPYRIDTQLIDRTPKLKFIVTPSTGRDHIDFDYCEKKGISVKALRGHTEVIENIHASAEFSFTLLMAMLRKLPMSLLAAQEGYWREVEDEFRGIELNGKKLGLVGYGRIGKKMGRYAQAFGAEIRVYDPHVAVSDDWIRQMSSLEELLSWADIVCAHVHLDPDTRQMFNRRTFGLMKKNAYFLNTSRGGVVDEPALLEAIRSGHLRAAAVDVIEDEQSGRIKDNMLIQFARKDERLIVSPHIAGLTVDSQGKAMRFALNELKRFFKLT